MIVLDTNVVSELMKTEPNSKVAAWLQNLGDEGLATTAITVGEITFGLERLPKGRRREDLQAAFATLLGALPVLALDHLAAEASGALRAKRLRAGLSAAASDMFIAGIAMAAEATLATRNTRDFDSLPLRLVDPWRS